MARWRESLAESRLAWWAMPWLPSVGGPMSPGRESSIIKGRSARGPTETAVPGKKSYWWPKEFVLIPKGGLILKKFAGMALKRGPRTEKPGTRNDNRTFLYLQETLPPNSGFGRGQRPNRKPKMKTPHSNSDVVNLECFPGQFLPKLRMGDVDHGFHPVPHGFSGEGGNSIIRDQIIHIIPRGSHCRAGLEDGDDSGNFPLRRAG